MAAHIATLLLDDYIGFSLVDVFVPGASGYARVATAIGVLAFWLLAIGVSNRLRRVLPYATWRRIHLLNFAVWVLALAQGIFEGTDTGTIWATAAYAVATSAVAGAVAWRFLRPRHVEEWALLLWPATAAVVSCELVVALALVG